MRAGKCLALGGFGTWAWPEVADEEKDLEPWRSHLPPRPLLLLPSRKWAENGISITTRRALPGSSHSSLRASPSRSRVDRTWGAERRRLGDFCISGPMGAPRGFHFLVSVPGSKATAWEDGQSPWLSCRNAVYQNSDTQDFPGRPVVTTPHFQCKGCGFSPWLGSHYPACHMMHTKKQVAHNVKSIAACAVDPQGVCPLD